MSCSGDLAVNYPATLFQVRRHCPRWNSRASICHYVGSYWADHYINFHRSNYNCIDSQQSQHEFEALRNFGERLSMVDLVFETVNWESEILSHNE